MGSFNSDIRVRDSFRAALVIFLFGLLFALPLRAQSTADAVAAYDSADFDRALELFNAIAADETMSRDETMTAFHYLGRIFAARRMEDEALGAIRSLLELEPPVVSLDPDMEPPPLIHAYYEARKEQGGYGVNSYDGQIRTIAVIDFTNGSFGPNASDYEPLSRGLAATMINQLGSATNLRVVERERLQWLLSELDLQQDAGRVNQATAVRMGELLGAQSVLIGSFIVNGKDMMLSTRMVSVETGELLTGEQVEGKVDKVFGLLRELSQKTAEAINATLEEDSSEGGDDSGSLDAMMSYSEALELLEQGDYQAAHAKFLEALDHDPEYDVAGRRAQSLIGMLD